MIKPPRTPCPRYVPIVANSTYPPLPLPTLSICYIDNKGVYGGLRVKTALATAIIGNPIRCVTPWAMGVGLRTTVDTPGKHSMQSPSPAKKPTRRTSKTDRRSDLRIINTRVRIYRLIKGPVSEPHNAKRQGSDARNGMRNGETHKTTTFRQAATTCLSSRGRATGRPAYRPAACRLSEGRRSGAAKVQALHRQALTTDRRAIVPTRFNDLTASEAPVTTLRKQEPTGCSRRSGPTLVSAADAVP